jgi:UDP-N-acetylmuramoyl-L-alanyl-D-glutamate--2,6-diaminopimelate ligase
VVVDDVRAAMGPAAARFHGDPTARLRTVGITGTNGKTTTAFLVRDVLEAAGLRTGLLGTVKRVVGGAEETVQRTTPEAIDLQAAFARMVAAGDRACAMEVSSHALELGRAAGITFACRVFTNLTQDHLDFHSDMEAYYLAKRALFVGPGPHVVNVDGNYGARLAGELGDGGGVITYGLEAGDYRARDVRRTRPSASGSRSCRSRSGPNCSALVRPTHSISWTRSAIRRPRFCVDCSMATTFR